MAEQCANCGRSDLFQAQLTTHQCLGCGEVTDDATGAVIKEGTVPVAVNNRGIPLTELSHNVVVDDAVEYERPDRDLEVPVEVPEPVETAPEADPEPEVDEPKPIDLTRLTPEQIRAIETIAYPDGSDEQDQD